MRIALIRLSAAALVRKSSQETFGGAEVRAVTFARGLAERAGHQVRLVIAAREGEDFAPLGRLKVHPIDVSNGWTPLASQRRQFAARLNAPIRRLSRSLQRRFGNHPVQCAEISQLPVDVVGCFGLHDPTASFIRSARQAGKRSMVFLTSDEDTERALGDQAVKDRRLRWHRYAIQQADLVIAQTEFQRQRLQAAGIPATLIRNPVDAGVTAGQWVPLHERQHVLWVGRADTDCKRADLCWQLARLCPHVRFVAVLNPQDPKTTRLLLEQTPPNVTVLPRVDWLASDALYRDALALVNTSESEGFPNAFLQAAKFGVPILSRRVNPDNVLTRFQLGFIAHDRLERLVAMVHQIHASPDRFSHVSRNGPLYVVRYHALHDRVSELEAALERVVRVSGERYAA